MSKRALTDRFLRTAPPGFYSDAAMPTLNIRVLPSGAKQWVQRLAVHGKPRQIGLGGYPIVGLKEARDAVLDNRRLARAGGGPSCTEKMPTIAYLCRSC